MNLLSLRIRIRPIRHEDLPFLQSLWNDGAVMRHQGYPEGMHATGADMERWWQAMQAARQGGHPGPGALTSPHCIIETVDGTPIGELTYSLDTQQRARIDLKVAPRYWAQGYATEALTLVMRELFASAAVRKIIVEPSATNHPAQQLLRRCAFHPAPTENHPDRWECERADFVRLLEGANAAE